MDLFGNPDKQKRKYRRDSKGKFADEKKATYEKALKEASMYKQMYFRELSRTRGVSKVIRLKDEQIRKLKG